VGKGEGGRGSKLCPQLFVWGPESKDLSRGAAAWGKTRDRMDPRGGKEIITSRRCQKKKALPGVRISTHDLKDSGAGQY